MSFNKFRAIDLYNEEPPRRCRGINMSKGIPCKNKPQDINYFCRQHYKQSQQYARNNPWYLVSVKNGIYETIFKVKGNSRGHTSIPGGKVISTSEMFASL